MNSSKNIFQTTGCFTQEQLLRYVKGEMTMEEKRAVELHLPDCEICFDAVEGLMLVEKSNLNAVEADLTRQVDELIQEQKRKKIIPFYARWYSMAAAIALLLFISFYLAKIYVNNGSENLAVNTAPSENTKPQSTVIAPQPTLNDSVAENQNSTGNSVVIKAPDLNKRIGNNNQSESKVEQKIAASEIAKGSVSDDNASIAVAEDKYLSKDETAERVTEEPALLSKTDAVKKDSESFKSTGGGANNATQLNSVTIDAVGKAYKSKNIEAPVSQPAPAALKETEKSNTDFDFELYDKGVDAFNNKDFETSQKVFRQILGKQPGNINANYYSGVSEYELKNYNESIRYLDAVIKNKRSSFYESALWYKSQCLLKTDKKTDAKKILESIVKYKGNYKTQAEQLLKELD